MEYTIKELLQMDNFDKAEITCRRMFAKFKQQYTKDKQQFVIQSTPSKTIYDANIKWIDKNGNKRKCQVEFKVRYQLYTEMFIEPKNVKHAVECQYEYLYINFYDDVKTNTRHMYIWSSKVIDFKKLPSEMKSISKKEVEESEEQYQLRYKLNIKDAEHYTTTITELWPECVTEEYLELWRENFFSKK
jgi:hypothetical protein